jgi:hypothetical protein
MKMLPAAHEPGRHCASTGIRDLLGFHGVRLSEAMCFGIGAGLGIWYLGLPGLSLSRLIHVRSADIEDQFFTRMGLRFLWEQFGDPVQSEQALREKIDRGIPALIRTDIYYLPYYESKTHFPGHVIVVWGYDEAREVFFVTDTGRKEITEVPFSAMREARHQVDSFFEMHGNLFAPEGIALPDGFGEIIRNAIVHNSTVILDDAHGYQGIRGLDTWLGELSDWGDFPDWQWVCRFTYQVIERRGTGGGGFRLMYADFLKESAGLVREVASLSLTEKMLALGHAWQDLAGALRDASEKDKPDFSRVEQELKTVRDLEEAFHKDAISMA